MVACTDLVWLAVAASMVVAVGMVAMVVVVAMALVVMAGVTATQTSEVREAEAASVHESAAAARRLGAGTGDPGGRQARPLQLLLAPLLLRPR